MKNEISDSDYEDLDSDYNVDDAVMAFFYLRTGFKRWLMENRGLKRKTAGDYIRKFDALYNSLTPIVGYDIYEMLYVFLSLDQAIADEDDSTEDEDWEIDYEDMIDYSDISWDGLIDDSGEDMDPDFYDDTIVPLRSESYEAMQKMISEIDTACAEEAPKLVDEYIDAINYEISNGNTNYDIESLRIMNAFHDYIVDASGTSHAKYLKPKTVPLPDEQEFQEWLISEYRNINYINARKMISSIRRLDLCAPSLVSEPMTFLDVLRAIPTKDKREKYVSRVTDRIKQIHKGFTAIPHSIENGISNVRFYVNFRCKKQ